MALPSSTDHGISHRARIGVVLLEADQTIEPEFATFRLPGVGFYHARIPSEPEINPDTLKAMDDRLPAAASQLPTEFGFKAIGYACTSAATVIGPDRVAASIRRHHPAALVTDPITATIEAFKDLGVDRIGVVTPYSANVTGPVLDVLEASGIEVTGAGSFLVENDFDVARLTPESVAEGIRAIDRSATCDGFFVSCTNVRLFDQVDALESELGRPVVSSNLALGWHLLRLAGITDQIDGRGTLLRDSNNR